MEAIGVIAELNPLHAGHCALITHLRQEEPNRPIVMALSGSFVQRGEAAILDKGLRAAMAIRAGVDLVLEIPARYVLQSASHFAWGGIRTLQGIPSVHALAFGVEESVFAESANPPKKENRQQKEAILHQAMQEGASYRAAHARVVGRALLPNEILAYQYIETLERLGLDWKIERVARPMESSASPSATKIREQLSAGVSPAKIEGLVESNLLQDAFHPLNTRPIVATLRVLAATGALDFSHSPHFEPGMDHRITNALETASFDADLEDIVNLAQNKRQSKARYRRLVLTTVLGIDIRPPAEIPYVRPLAFNETGRALLRDVELPILQKKPSFSLSPIGEALSAIDRKADRLSELIRENKSAPLPYFMEEKRPDD